MGGMTLKEASDALEKMNNTRLGVREDEANRIISALLDEVSLAQARAAEYLITEEETPMDLAQSLSHL